MIKNVLTKFNNLMATHADWLAFAAAFSITVLSLLPRSTAAGAPANDLLYHFIAYAVLTGFALYRRATITAGAVALALVIALGGIIEIIQPLFGRAGDLNDFAANGLGALAGGILMFGLRHWRRQET